MKSAAIMNRTRSLKRKISTLENELAAAKRKLSMLERKDELHESQN